MGLPKLVAPKSSIISERRHLMANSTLIATMKQSVIDAICDDPGLFAAIDPDSALCSTGKDMIWNCIFPYHQLPGSLTTAPTFLSVTVHAKLRENSNTFMAATLDIYIYTRRNHLRLPEGQTGTRLDWIAALLNERFNGSTAHGGLDKLRLVETTEGACKDDYCFRRMQFRTVDANDPFCESW